MDGNIWGQFPVTEEVTVAGPVNAYLEGGCSMATLKLQPHSLVMYYWFYHRPRWTSREEEGDIRQHLQLLRPKFWGYGHQDLPSLEYYDITFHFYNEGMSNALHEYFRDFFFLQLWYV